MEVVGLCSKDFVLFVAEVVELTLNEHFGLYEADKGE